MFTDAEIYCTTVHAEITVSFWWVVSHIRPGGFNGKKAPQYTPQKEMLELIGSRN